MPDIFQEDFRDFLQTLNDHEVRYIMVGGLAFAVACVSRVITSYMNLWCLLYRRTRKSWA